MQNEIKNYSITGMTCSACSARVEKVVSNIDGIQACSVNLLTNSMQVKGDVDSATIIEAVEKAGYGASLKNKTEKNSKVSQDVDSLKNKDIPILNLTIDENITELSLETKLESFIDILKQGENNE